MNRDLTYLLDLEKTCRTIVELVEGMSKESFLIDRRTYLAILYEITVTGEIVKQLSLSFRQENSEIPRKQIAGMRDKLIHDYNEVNLELTWEVTQTDIPALLEFILPFLLSEENL